MIKILGGSTAILAVICVMLYQRTEILELEKQQERQGRILAEGVASEQKNTIATLGKLKEADNKRLEKFETSIADAQKETQDANNQINIMRVTEEIKALQKPFERGIAANIRLGGIWLRFQDGNISGGISTDPASTDDT